MDGLWRNAYIRKLTGNYYDIEILQRFVSNEVENINNFLKRIGEKAEFDKGKNCITFPDCIINIKIDGPLLEFKKLAKNNQSSIIDSVTVYDLGTTYKVKTKDNQEIMQDVHMQNIVETVFSYLLVFSKPK
ncbi:hypothetical protein NG54_03295 [Heyndrickxia ginsengihumi]|uniref:Uncharacterized protein n=1 Tax=Heyndrickxia ginsengihumi TaxID=363870 RepID=A0A0A6VFL1_9BACI|nr:hypothetical protein [Heyndrickxia ginsengihumi]KHD86356.1 hypothetical protein NG54_03295 [Heyndrickxia ginsengihumi]